MSDKQTLQYSQPKVYVVSLPRTTERRKSITAQLSRLGVAFMFIDAVDATQVDPEWLRAQVDEKAVMRNMKRHLSGPEIACALSHRIAYKDIVDNDRCGGVILEDDVILPPAFLDALTWFKKHGRTLANIHAVYHLCALSLPCARLLILDWHKSRVSDRLSFVELGGWQVRELVGTCGYFVTRAAAQTLLVPRRLETVADHWCTWGRRAGARLFVSVPAAVIHPDGPERSEIEASRKALVEDRKAMQYSCYRMVRYLYYGIQNRTIQLVVKPVAEAILRFVYRSAKEAKPMTLSNSIDAGPCRKK